MGCFCFGRKKKQNKYLSDNVTQGPQGSNQSKLNRRKSFYLVSCCEGFSLCADLGEAGGGHGGDGGGAGGGHGGAGGGHGGDGGGSGWGDFGGGSW